MNNEADKWDLSVPSHTSAFLTGAQVCSCVSYALFFGLTSFIFPVEPTDKLIVTLPIQLLTTAAFIGKLMQIYYLKQPNAPWSTKVMREMGAAVAGAQVIAILSFFLMLGTSALISPEFPAGARSALIWSSGSIFGLCYILRGVQYYLASQAGAAEKILKAAESVKSKTVAEKQE
ncbi:hypothetical protein HDU98_003936 [Podochytrium sp. JEL0797]|nr:hypothetical protein HDU98_003936 [Podochytrium sp. JEL0797]